MATEAIDTETAGRDSGYVESIRTALRELRDSASVENVYGDPIAAEGKTIVPVARVAYGFGGGFGSSAETDEEGGEGGGGGGGVFAQPIGVLEVTADGSRFVRFTSDRRMVLAAGLGLVLGALLGRRRTA